MRYFYCTYQYYINGTPAAVSTGNVSTNHGVGQCVVKGKDCNLIDTIIQTKGKHPDWAMVLPVMWQPITKKQYDRYMAEIALAVAP